MQKIIKMFFKVVCFNQNIFLLIKAFHNSLNSLNFLLCIKAIHGVYNFIGGRQIHIWK